MKNHGKNSETILLNNTRFRYFLLAVVRDFTSVFTIPDSVSVRSSFWDTKARKLAHKACPTERFTSTTKFICGRSGGETQRTQRVNKNWMLF